MITAAMVNDLRQKTGAGMMDCKKALTEANGDIEKAVEILRKKGASVAAKRADKDANEGIVLTKVLNSKKEGFALEINCETDFVAKSDDFVAFANKIMALVETLKPANAEELFNQNPEIKSDFDALVGKIGEKIVISRIGHLVGDNSLVVDYVHPGSKLGVIVQFDNIESKASDFENIAKDIAMQVAAMNPIAVYREDVPKDLIEKEIEIYKEVSRKEGKPENILEKIAQGKLNKFYQENCLFEQAFIKDNSKTVSDLIKEFNSANGTSVKIFKFLRYHLGDEKKS